MPATLIRGRRSARRRAPGPVHRPIRTEKEYANAVAEIELLLDAEPPAGSPTHDRMELLSILVEAYEEDHDDSIESSSPQQIVEFMAEQKQIDRTTLAGLMGGRSRLSDFLGGKRRLSLRQIQRLRKALAVPADLLI